MTGVTAGEHLARWQGGVDERLDNAEESVQEIKTTVAGLLGRVGVLEVASGQFGVKIAMLVLLLGSVGGIVGTAVASLVVFALTHG